MVLNSPSRQCLGYLCRAAQAEFSPFACEMGGNEALKRSELLIVPVDLRILGKPLCF